MGEAVRARRDDLLRMTVHPPVAPRVSKLREHAGHGANEDMRSGVNDDLRRWPANHHATTKPEATLRESRPGQKHKTDENYLGDIGSRPHTASTAAPCSVTTRANHGPR